MINTKEDYTPTGSYEELGADFSDAVSASIQSAVEEGPTNKFLDFDKLRTFEREAKFYDEPFLTRQQAQEEAAQKGIAIQNLPEQISRKGFDFLAERQYQAKKRNDIINREGSLSTSLLGGLVGSFIDPVNLATSFVPVGKIGALGQWAMKTRAPIANISSKAVIGAVEGVAGAAMVEPLLYGVSQSLGDDYGVAESALNLGIGAVMGSMLHASASIISETVSHAKSSPVSREAAKIKRQIDAMSIEQKDSFFKGILAQGVEDRHLDVTLMQEAIRLDTIKQIEQVEIDLKKAIVDRDAGALAYLTTKKEILADQFDPGLLEEARSKIPKDPTNLQDAPPYVVDIENIKQGLKENNLEINEKSTLDLAETRIKQSLDDAQTVSVKTPKGDVEIVSIKDGVLKDVNGNEHLLKNKIDEGVTISPTEFSKDVNPVAHAEVMTSMRKAVDSSKKDLMQKAKESATLPDSKYLDQNLIDKQNELIVSDSKLEEFENLKTETNSDSKIAQEFAEQNGMDLENIFERHDVNIKEVDTHAKLFHAMANCVLSKGA